MNKANYALRLLPSLKVAAERLAAEDGTSLNQFINIAVAEKLSALEAERYFTERASRVDRTEAMRFLDEAGAETPAPGDELADGSRT